MNKKILIPLFVLFVVVGSVLAGNTSINYGWNGSAYIPFKLASDGKLMTDINKINLTAGSLFVAGDSNVSGTYYGDGSGLTGVIASSTSWNHSGTNVILTNIGDNVSIGYTNPSQKLAVNGNICEDNGAVTSCSSDKRLSEK